MTEWEKAQEGYSYDANYDRDIVEARQKCANLCYELNLCRPTDRVKRAAIMHQLLGEIKGSFVITALFYCDYGSNISIGNHFYMNHNGTILDGAKVSFGDNVFIAPNCVFFNGGASD